MTVAARRKPARTRRPARWKPSNAASLRGLEAARAALADPTPGPVGDDAIALLEQQRVELDARQPALPLRVVS